MKKLNLNPVFEDWASHWMELYVKPVAKPSGYEHYHDNLYKHILPALGKYRLNSLTIPVIQSFLNDKALHGNLRNGGPLSSKSIKNMRVVLDVCFKRAVAEGYMKANPVPMTVYKHCTGQRVEVMNNNDQEKLEEYLFKDISCQNAGIILALYNGMRLGEVCAARWKSYDFQRCSLQVIQTVRRVSNFQADAEYGKRTQLIFSDTKTAASKRELFFPPILQNLMILQYNRFIECFGYEPGPEDFIVFNTNGGVTDPDNLSHYFGDILHCLGLNHVKFHALRHTFASRAVENGIDVATVSGILGHADVTTTTHYYVHPREEAMRRAMSTISPISSSRIQTNSPIPLGSWHTAKQNEPVPKRVCRRKKSISHATNV